MNLGQWSKHEHLCVDCGFSIYRSCCCNEPDAETYCEHCTPDEDPYLLSSIEDGLSHV